MITQLISKSNILAEEETAKTYYLKGITTREHLNLALSTFNRIAEFCESAIFEVGGHETIDLTKASNFQVSANLSEVTYQLEVDKKTSTNFPIFNFASFRKSFDSAFKNIDTLFGYLNRSLNNPVLVESHTYPLATFVDDDNNIKIEFLSKAISQTKKAEITIAPSQITFTNDSSLPANVASFFKSILAFYSLLFLSSNIKKENQASINVTIDGYREISFTFSSEDICDRFCEALVYHDIACWIFSDTPGKPSHLQKQIYSERIGIARNIISLEISPEKADSAFTPSASIFRKCRSHFNVYLKSRTKEYFDIRMKLDDHVDKLSKSLSDEVSLFVTTFRANMYGFISIIFTSLLVQATKTDVQNSFLTGSNSVSFLIAGYGAFNLLLLAITSAKLYYSMGNIDAEKKYLIERYGKLLDNQDVQESVDGIMNRRLIRSRWQFGIIAVGWVILSALLIFNRPLYKLSFPDSPPVGEEPAKPKVTKPGKATHQG